MKKIFFGLSILTCISISAQKKSSNILNSTNITEIENFLKTVHPDDTRSKILKNRIISLKNAKWMDYGRTTYSKVSATEVNSNRFANQISQYTVNERASFINASVNEEDEFRKLIFESSKTHKEKTIKLLNQLFDNDISNEHAILLIKNTGNCNMIIRIQGKEFYNLAVPANGENFLTLKKGDYKLSGNMCEARYYATKSIAKNMFVTLTKSSAKFIDEKFTTNTNGISN